MTFTSDVNGDIELSSALQISITRDGVPIVSGASLETLVPHTFALPSGGSADYHFAVALPACTGNAAMGKRAGADFSSPSHNIE